MNKLLEFVGVVLILEGAAGLIHELIGWFRLVAIVRHLDFLDGYEVLANAGLIGLGFVALTLAGDGEASAEGGP